MWEFLSVGNGPLMQDVKCQVAKKIFSTLSLHLYDFPASVSTQSKYFQHLKFTVSTHLNLLCPKEANGCTRRKIHTAIH